MTVTLQGLKQRRNYLFELSFQVGSWSKCSKTCGSGHQIRGVFCSKSDNIPLDSTACAGKLKPVGLRKCFLKDCILKRGLCKNPKSFSRNNMEEISSVNKVIMITTFDLLICCQAVKLNLLHIQRGIWRLLSQN